MLAGYPPFFTEDGNPMKLYEKVSYGFASLMTDHSGQSEVPNLFRRIGQGTAQESVGRRSIQTVRKPARRIFRYLCTWMVLRSRLGQII